MVSEPESDPGRLSPEGIEALRLQLLGNGAMVPVLEALDLCVLIFSTGGQLVHANAAALKTLDQVGVHSAMGLRLEELLPNVGPGATGGADANNAEAIQLMRRAMQGTPCSGPVVLHLEQSAQFFVGKFEVKAVPVRFEQQELHLLLLRQVSLVKARKHASP